MTLEDLLLLHEAMPPGSSISLSKEALAELLDGLSPPRGGAQDGGDLTLEEVAERVGRAPSTVRGWCRCGRIIGSYRLNGRDWRVPLSGLDAFLRTQDERREGPTIGGHNLSAWRKDHGTKESTNRSDQHDESEPNSLSTGRSR